MFNGTSRLTANLKVSYSHDFNVGNFLIKVSPNGEISHFFVDEVISNEKIKTRAVLRDGSLSNGTVIFERRDLDSLYCNFPANKPK